MIAQIGRMGAIFAIAWPGPRRNVVLVSATMTSSPVGAAATVESEPLLERSEIIRAAAGIGLYAGAFGVTFGAVSSTAGLSVIQAVGMSAVMFTGASQFALIGILAAGGAPLAGLSAALLLGLRNAFYGVPVTDIVRPRGLRRLWTAHFVIDETTAMAVSQRTRRAGRYAFWATGVTLYALWTLGTLAGALIGSGIDTSALGLDAAAPAIFLALLWPQLSHDRAPAVVLGAIVVTLALGPVAPAGVPIVAAAGVAIAAGLLPTRPRRRRHDR
jgi:4-azaleucine resistance transporter AzlC